MPTRHNTLHSLHAAPASEEPRLPPEPEHEPTPTDFMLYGRWAAQRLAREPLPMLPMPPIRRAAKSTRRSLRRSGSRLSLRTRIAAIAAGTLLCGVLFGSAILWITHHASTASNVTLALHKNTPLA
jgi:hypothetical protein